MKRLYDLLLSMVAVCMTFSSCSDDTVTKTPLQVPVVSEGVKTVSTIAFSWTPVEGASQYAYELYDADDRQVSGYGGVTSATSYIASGLQHNTTYTLKVWAYSPVDGNRTTSPVATLTATTNAPQPLGQLQEAETGINGSSVTVTWPQVDHATAYTYTLVSGGETVNAGTVSDNSVTFNKLAEGDYTLTLVATSDDENYADSEPFTVTFSVEIKKQELWRHTGTYTSAALGQSFTADIVSYDDGSYTIEAPFGEEGYDISFRVDEETGILSPIDVYVDEYNYAYYYPSSEYYLASYFNGTAYSNFSGDRNNGEVWFSTYLYKMDGTQVGGFAYDDFTWSTDALTMDDLCGTYSAHVTCYDYFDYTAWATIDRIDEVTISDNGDGTVNIYNFYNWAENFTAKVDLSARTLTIDPVASWGGYFTFADATDQTAPVVGTVNADNTITFSDFGAWYSDYSYIYAGSECVMTKKTEN